MSGIFKFGAAAAIAAVCLVFGFGTVDPAHVRFPLLEILAAMLVFMGVVKAWRTEEIKVSRCDVAVLALGGYMGVSLAYSSDWREGLAQFVIVLSVTVIFLFARRSPWLREIIPWAAVISLTGAAILWVIVPTQYHGGFGNENFFGEFVMILFPFVAMLAWEGAEKFDKTVKIGCTVLCLMAIGYIAAISLSHEKYVVVGALGVALLGWQIKRKFWFAASMTVLVPMNAVILSGMYKNVDIFNSIIHRAEIWINTVAMWWSSPVFGKGIGSFNYEYPLFAEVHKSLIPGTMTKQVTMLMGAAHNEPLQILAEFGIVGLVLAFFVVWLVVRNFKPSPINIASLASLGVAGALSMVSFPLHEPATALFIVLSGAMLAQGDKIAFTLALPRRRTILTAVGVVLAIGLSTNARAVYKAQQDFAFTRMTLGVRPLEAFQANLMAYRKYPLDFHIRHQLMLSLSAVSRTYKMKPEWELDLSNEAADLTYRISQTAGKHNPAIKLARAEYLLNSGRWEFQQEEMEGILSALKKNASLQGGTWVVEASYAGHLKDIKRVVSAVVHALNVPYLIPMHRRYFDEIARSIAEENPS